MRINSQGLRDREHPKAKPPNTLRIAVLGDSYPEAFQLPMENAFWAVMERELASCPVVAGRTVEAINFGVSGYSTTQELLVLRHKVWAYDPDIILLTVTTGNDIRTNSRALEGDPRWPYFVRQDGTLVLDDSFRDTPRYKVRHFLDRTGISGFLARWRVYQAATNVGQALRARRQAAPPPAAQDGAGAPVAELGLDSVIYREPADPLWQDAWQVTEDLLVAVRDEVATHGKQLLVVTLSNPIQVHPDGAKREEFMKRLGVDALFYPETRIAALADREGIPLLTLAQPFLAYAEERNAFLHGYDKNLGGGHWNEEGHRLGGTLIAQRLCTTIAAS